MAVFRDLDMSWQGKTYTVTPSNRLLRRIEGEVGSLTSMIAKIGAGEPPVSETCYVVAELLKAGGADVNEDEVYGEVMTALANGQEEAFAEMAVSVVEAISPQGLTGKKPEAREEKPKAKKASKSRK